MQVAELKDGEAVEHLRQLRRGDAVVSERDLGGVVDAPPIEAGGHEDRPNEKMRRREVLDMKEVQSLAEDLRLVVLLDAQTLPRVQPSEALLKRVRNIVIDRHEGSCPRCIFRLSTLADLTQARNEVVRVRAMTENVNHGDKDAVVVPLYKYGVR